MSQGNHFAGFFLNKVPLFCKLKWCEIVGTRLVWGDFNTDKHNSIMLPNEMKGLGKKPYTEFSLGIENILKIFRVDGVWRFTSDDVKLKCVIFLHKAIILI